MVCPPDFLLLTAQNPEDMIDIINTEYLLTDDSVTIVDKAEMKVVIPLRKNRKYMLDYDKALYKIRHLAENAFLYLKISGLLQFVM